MIDICLQRNSSGSLWAFSLKGHAKAAPHGQDIVCAGVSALAQAAVLGLERHLRMELHLSVAEGLLEAELKEAPTEQSSAILETMLLGLREIERLYPRYLKIRENRR